MAEHQFTDLVTNQECTLVIPPNGRPLAPRVDEDKIGVRHPHCDELADVAVEFDAFFCRACKWNGRVSGAWCLDKIEEAMHRG